MKEMHLDLYRSSKIRVCLCFDSIYFKPWIATLIIISKPNDHAKIDIDLAVWMDFVYEN